MELVVLVVGAEVVGMATLGLCVKADMDEYLEGADVCSELRLRLGRVGVQEPKKQLLRVHAGGEDGHRHPTPLLQQLPRLERVPIPHGIDDREHPLPQRNRKQLTPFRIGAVNVHARTAMIAFPSDTLQEVLHFGLQSLVRASSRLFGGEAGPTTFRRGHADHAFGSTGTAMQHQRRCVVHCVGDVRHDGQAPHPRRLREPIIPAILGDLGANRFAPRVVGL
mmetsp:Transcript_4608/g.13084  ORF Transcript_4608/g.13084 Transcript_4608/m.13084 type:complete len:222 (-) Transcript_4608:224-889(-)